MLYCYRRSSVVCRCVCLFLGHVRQPCKNGWTDRDADWRLDRLAQGTMYWMGVQIPEGKRQFLFGHCESLYRCTQQKIISGICATIATDYVAPTGRCHVKVSPWKIYPPAMCSLLEFFFNHLLIFWLYNDLDFYMIAFSLSKDLS